MLLPLRHEVLGPGLHRFVFPSESRKGVTHELLLDLHDEGPGRLSCLCEAALHDRVCKHKRLFILGLEALAEAEERRAACLTTLTRSDGSAATAEHAEGAVLRSSPLPRDSA